MNWIKPFLNEMWRHRKILVLAWNMVVFNPYLQSNTFFLNYYISLYIVSTEVLTVFVSTEELDMKLNRLDPGLLLHILFLELDIVCNLIWEMTAIIFVLRWLVGSERWPLITRGWCLSIFEDHLATDSGIAGRDLSVLQCLCSFNVFQLSSLDRRNINTWQLVYTSTMLVNG